MSNVKTRLFFDLNWYTLNITQAILWFSARQRTPTLFRNAYFNLFVRTAKCRSSFLLIGSTVFMLLFYGLYSSETFPGERARRRRRFIFLRLSFFSGVYRRLELVRLDRHPAYSLFSCAFFHPLLHSLSLLCK